LDEKIEKYSITCKQYQTEPWPEFTALAKYRDYLTKYIDEAIAEQTKRLDENNIQLRQSVQTSLFNYQNLIFKFENHKIF